MERSLKWTFENGWTADVILVNVSTNLPVALGQVGLYPPRPTIVIVGGASGLNEADLNRLHPLFADALAPLAESLQAAVVDGGTDCGVMRLIGQTRTKTSAAFPLIGVLPAGKVALPDMPPPTKATQLEPHHSHFVLVPGSQWGDESFWLAQVASVITGGAPSVTVLVNGGNIAWQDVSESVRHGRPVIVIDGSGRTADILADALHGQSAHSQANELAASGLLQAVDVMAGADALVRILKETLASRY